MSARTRMLARDLWHLRGQVLAAALVVACGMASLIGMYSTSTRSSRRVGDTTKSIDWQKCSRSSSAPHRVWRRTSRGFRVWRGRLQGLAEQKLVAEQALDQAKTAEAAASHAVLAAGHRVVAAAAEVEEVRAGLVSTTAETSGQARTLLIRAPVAGRVLRVPEKSDRVVPAGSQLIIVGDLSGIQAGAEIITDGCIKISALVFSAGIGVVFGYFPARRAARMDPIEALRHE